MAVVRSVHLTKRIWKSTPKSPPHTKKRRIFRRTFPISTEGSARLVTTVSAMIPRMSSIRAAPMIAFPAFVESLPSSLRVSTVILTEVAVSIIPINIFWRNTLVGRVDSPLLNK